ncbi:UTP--glucose-1-phosphate uridylyltransferase GalU [Legionella jordanis]|uniref:UTP--glucose-1-phosphate uridylyltransferase n=1 Tax=Legionella jordanis TaxID=456 RepID=A0A0W0VFZ8_9GAMM|nr:UTP--glucose-1-phosphate uridylyltransferase GalU [Legionella jordanis]KTD19060.1 glucose-1-phosphate uridylyltransferase [Legionella jordanis]RMX05387.1 UTP--glucose-1-phosphate uridylyltransferase [Legionella jordanis]VEH13163.1 glucose-1-phosphate uridylyltransferase [Legionella jordanis]HAT8714820.1 UTP--glucose-1-phosphate uridylyltransferase GalU [Legionella jordanis]
MVKKLKKAVFPVAGLGSRFLPATKANPKEMLPVVDKPIIQYAVEEAVEAGFSELIFITNSSKRAIEDHFDVNYELQNRLSTEGKYSLLSTINFLPAPIRCTFIRQPEPKGLGDAIRCAKHVINDEPFAVILPDDLIMSNSQNCLGQMAALYQNTQANILAIEKIDLADSNKYGVISVSQYFETYYEINGIVEKPAPEESPSSLGVVGRYIFNPEIFSFLETISPGKNDEIQLTDAIKQLINVQEVFGYKIQGKRYDCGDKFGFVKATIQYALKHPEIGEKVRHYFDNFSELTV